jgi:hypothetical protein
MPEKPSALNELLRQQLLAARELDHQVTTKNTSGTILEIPDTGKAVSGAYEQLRNAAEYAEEHLLLQKAIRRFFNRNLFITNRKRHDLGLELIIDLTQAGYLQGKHYNKSVTSTLGTLVEQYMETHRQLRQARITRETADNWILALLSTEAENLLNPHNVQQSILPLAYNYFLQAMPAERFADTSEPNDYELCLYIAIHQAILKSDLDVIRHDLHRLYKQSLEDTDGFIHLSKKVDELFSDRQTQMLKRTVSRHGAPFRILKGLNNDYVDIAELLPERQVFLAAYSKQIDHEYQRLGKRLAKGLLKSITFIIITKLLIGAAMEVPYDILVHGNVMLLPLAVNLFFPPLYLVSIVSNLRLPSDANKRSVYNFMEQMLYGDAAPQIQAPRRRRASKSTKIAYILLFVIPMMLTVLILDSIGFNAMQMIIFFIFFSATSFLGFRLSAMVRDLELIPRRAGLLGSLQDFFYLPFVTLGQWLSRKYSQINIVARFLDVAVELPLKSVLRLLQQWMNFLREQHENLY